jgi:hypothetical protein
MIVAEAWEVGVADAKTIDDDQSPVAQTKTRAIGLSVFHKMEIGTPYHSSFQHQQVTGSNCPFLSVIPCADHVFEPV